MSAPVVVVARLYPLAERIDEALAAVLVAVPGIVAEEGCELYAPHLANDGTIVIVEKWTSEEALATHDTGAAVGVLRSGLAGMMAGPAEVKTMVALPGDLPAGAVL